MAYPFDGNVVWEPHAGSQALALTCPCDEILYEGSRGPGKTDDQLMFFRKYVGMGYGRHWRGVIFDREYKNLDDLVSKSQRWFNQFGDGAKFHTGLASYKWVWPTGEELYFRAIKRPEHYWLYHGQEFPFIGWNELTKYPDRVLYDSMLSCNRTSFVPKDHPLPDGTLLPRIPLVVFSTTNPFGPGHSWVKRYFVDAAPPGVPVRTTTNVFNPQTQRREDVTRSRVRIFGSYMENRKLPPEYVAMLESIKEPNKRRAWLLGDWDITAGGAVDDLWTQDVHMLPRFRIPAGWRIDRSFDWGSTKPFSCGWWAEADGTEAVLPTGRVFCPPRGSLIRILDYYGAKDVYENVGTKQSARVTADEILRRDRILLESGLIQTPVRAGPADNAIRNVVEAESDSIEVKMAKQGCHWTSSDKRPGSRKNGLQLIRDMLEASLTGEGPGLYITTDCPAALATFPCIPRDEDDPDDVDTDAPDHVYDEIRYRVAAGRNRYATALNGSVAC